MKSFAGKRFWRCYADLAPEVQKQADVAYRLWCDDPFHNSLQFKRIKENLWSVRIGIGWRALGVRSSPEEIVRFWIGSHAEYDRLTK